jgi:hypothetical protein
MLSVFKLFDIATGCLRKVECDTLEDDETFMQWSAIFDGENPSPPPGSIVLRGMLKHPSFLSAHPSLFIVTVRFL